MVGQSLSRRTLNVTESLKIALPTLKYGTDDQNAAFYCHVRQLVGSESCEVVMLSWALTFLVVALIAAVLGFGGIAGAAVDIAKLIFFVAIVLFAISAVVGLLRGRSPSTRL